MKISRIPNFGSFGVYVDNIDMNHMTEEEWHKLGQLFINELVVICRDIKIDKTQYLDWIPKWGTPKAGVRARFRAKYGVDFDATKPETWKDLKLDEADRTWLERRGNQLEESGDGRFLTRVYGRKDENGVPLGYFSHGEIHWHSNESSTLTFSPAVSLLGWEHMVGSATGFVQTVDLYESVSESFRSELNEMVLVHRYEVGKMNENEYTDDVLALHMKMAFCPNDGAETPMVCTAPNGRKGLHYTVNTRAEIKGMTPEQSQRVFDELDRLVFDKKWIHDHHYQTDNDLLLFDNSVTLHRRLGGHEDRKAFRIQFDVSPLLEQPWKPWQGLPTYHAQYVDEIHKLVDSYGGDLKKTFKLP